MLAGAGPAGPDTDALGEVVLGWGFRFREPPSPRQESWFQAMTSFPPSASSSPARAVDRVVPVKPLRYHLYQQVGDYFHGVVDARHHHDCALVDLAWVRRRQAALNQQCQRLLEGTHLQVGGQLSRLTEHAHLLEVLDAQLQVAIDGLEKVPPRASGYGELHLGHQAATRPDPVKNAAQASVNALRADRARLEQDAAPDVAAVTTAFQTTVHTCRTHLQLAQRRLYTYTRRLALHREDLQDLAGTLTLPAWVDTPCPWIPPRLQPTTAPARVVPAMALHVA